MVDDVEHVQRTQVLSELLLVFLDPGHVFCWKGVTTLHADLDAAGVDHDAKAEVVGHLRPSSKARGQAEQAVLLYYLLQYACATVLALYAFLREALEGKDASLVLAVVDCAKGTASTITNVMDRAFCINVNYRDSAKGKVSESHFQVDEFVIFGVPSDFDEEPTGKLLTFV